MQFAAQDCQLLSRFQESMPWNNAAESDRNEIKDLWNRLKQVAIQSAKQYSGSTEVKEFSSHPTPNGRTPKELWCCIYPKAVPNKPYGLQVALRALSKAISVAPHETMPPTGRWTTRLGLQRAQTMSEVGLETEPEWRLLEWLRANRVAPSITLATASMHSVENPKGRA